MAYGLQFVVIASGIMMVEQQHFVKKVALNLEKLLEEFLCQVMAFRLEYATVKILQMEIGLIVLELVIK